MTEPWEKWVGSTTAPVEHIKRGAKVELRDGRRWSTYRDDINRTNVIIDMRDNAPTKSCDHGCHDSCPHRVGGPQEGAAQTA